MWAHTTSALTFGRDLVQQFSGGAIGALMHGVAHWILGCGVGRRFWARDHRLRQLLQAGLAWVNPP